MATKKKKLFIGWSGKASGEAARHLQRWISQVFPEIDSFISEDIQKGDAWFKTLLNRLRQSQSIVVCITKDNLNEPWIAFEAGAIGVRTGPGRVMPLLLDLKKSELQSPLNLFQATTWNHADVLKLIQSLCSNLNLSEQNVKDRFNKRWPLLNANIKRAIAISILNEYDSSIAILPRKLKVFARRSLKRREEIIQLVQQQYKPPRHWTSDPTLRVTELLKEAEEDDKAWPLQVGDRVEVQCFEHVDHNGEIGVCREQWARAAQHFHVSFSNPSGASERVYHVMYLTREILLNS